MRRAFGCTFNDVVMAVCAGALRRWLAAHGGVPGQPLVAGVPFSLSEEGGHGNQVTFMTAPLAVHLDDPVARLQEVRQAMRSIRIRRDQFPHMRED